MDLQKLIEMQAVLDADITAKHPVQENEDRRAAKILALQVELAELAQEWRGFKFWSIDKNPRTAEPIKCFACDGTGDENYEFIQEAAEGGARYKYSECVDCCGTGYDGERNPLLEEYVDVLHFILSIGNEKPAHARFIYEHSSNYGLWLDVVLPYEPGSPIILEHFIYLNRKTSDYYDFAALENYRQIFLTFIELGARLGLNWAQIEQAYFDKNKENHARQERGY